MIATSFACAFLFVPRLEDRLRLEEEAAMRISVGGGGRRRLLSGFSAGAAFPIALHEIPSPIASPSEPISAPGTGRSKSRSSRSASEMRLEAGWYADGEAGTGTSLESEARTGQDG